LEAEGLQSVPVFDESNKFIGFLDVSDVVLFVIGLFPKDIALDKISEADFSSVLDSGSKFTKTEVGDLISMRNYFASNIGSIRKSNS
jgi:Mg/Co/Ni transporter MgtE